MSIAALVLGTETHLRSAAVFNDQPAEAVGKFVGAQPNPGKPPANFGQWYAAVSFNGGRGNDFNPQRADEMMNVLVTLTFRLNYSPRDRQSKQLTRTFAANVRGMYEVAETVKTAVHGNWTLINTANALITGTAAHVAARGTGTATVNGFMETLVLESVSPERPVGADWIGTETKDVYVMDIRFKDARRIQRIY